MRETRVSRVVTWTFSVLLSSNALLDGRGFPDADLLCAVPDVPSCGCGVGWGEGPCFLRSERSLLKLSWPDSRAREAAAFSVLVPAAPFVLLPFSGCAELLDTEDIAEVYS